MKKIKGLKRIQVNKGSNRKESQELIENVMKDGKRKKEIIKMSKNGKGRKETSKLR